MGECIIARSSGGTSSGGEVIVTNLPVLNSAYPMDVEFDYNESGYTFSVLVEQYISGCTYQWYKDNQPVIGETNQYYTFIPEDIYATYNIFCVISNSLGSVTSRTALFTCWPSKLHIIKNGMKNSIITGNFSIDNGNSGNGRGQIDELSDVFIFSTYGTGRIFCRTSKSIPFSRYNSLNCTYQKDNSSISGGIIYLPSGNYIYDYGSTINKNISIDEFYGNINDGKFSFHINDNATAYACMYIYDCYLYKK